MLINKLIKIKICKEFMDKKFIETVDTSDWEIETPYGWEPIEEMGKTIKYDIYELETDSNKKVQCADRHILIDNKNNEKYLIELNKNDLIKTKDGDEKIKSIIKTNKRENMFDFKMAKNTSHVFYANDILHHNTTWLGNIAIEMVKLGMNGAFISLEMPEYAMLQRFGPKLFNIKSKDFEEISQNPYEVGKLIQKFKSINIMDDNLFEDKHPGELFLKEFPTSTATTNDVRTYIKQLEEKNKIKLDFVVVDYINIMANWRNPNGDNTYIKIKQIAEDLRAISQIMKVTMISATQTKSGNEEASDFSSGAISESSGLNHTVDSEWGIIMSPEMYAKKEYILKSLLNRHGGMKFAKKKFFVDFDYMSIKESNEPIYDDNGPIYD